MQFCHGTNESLRVLEPGMFYYFPVLGFFGSRDGLKRIQARPRNPDSYRRYIPGEPRTPENYAEPPPFPQFEYCPKCGFVTSGDFSIHKRASKNTFDWLNNGGEG